MSDKPIYSEEAEAALIGCIYTSEGAVLENLEVLPDHFFHFANRTLAEVAIKLHSEGKPVNVITAMQTLTSDEINKIGGRAHIMQVGFYPAPLSNAAHYLAIANDLLRLRRAQEIGAWLGRSITKDANPDAICDGIKKRLGNLETTTATDNILEHSITAIRLTLAQIEDGQQEQGIEMPWRAWNRPFGGLHPGTMYVLAGRPGTGKTALMEEMIGACMAQGHPVLVFEKDMSPKTLVERMACRMANVPHFALRNGRINAAQSRQISLMLDLLEKSPLHLYNPGDFTAERMCGIVRKLVRQKGVKAVFLDHVQVLKTKAGQHREDLTRASILIRDCCTTTNVPHVILAHVNRESVGKAGTKPICPRPEDIKEFDQAYGDCDVMAMLWTEQNADDIDPGLPLEVNLFAAKNRSGPSRIQEKLSFNLPLMHFSDRE